MTAAGTHLVHLTNADGVLLRRATRVAVVMPTYFWVCSVLLDRPVVALFGSFGSFALLAMGDFGGPLPRRAMAYAVSTGVGAILVAVGTLASASIPVAVALMLVVGFAVAYVGALGGYYVAAAPALTLAYVLAATVPAPADQVPERVAGWLAAGVVSTVAAVVLWPVHERRRIGEAIAGACRAVAGAVRSGGTGPGRAAQDAVMAARLRFWSSPRRPAGPSEHDRAVVRLLDALDWLAELLVTPGELGSQGDALVDVTAATLDGCAHGVEAQTVVGVDTITTARAQHLDHLRNAVADDLGRGAPAGSIVSRIQGAFLPRIASLAAEAAASATTAARTPATVGSLGTTVTRAGHLLRAHLHLRSVWLRNCLRMGLALALAVAVALAGNVPHAFWVALGALTALRSNALGTGRTVVAALVGTVIGFGVSIGVLALAGDQLVLWLVLPIAVFLSAWAPTALSFVVGQASFTVFVVVLFNLIDAIGWRVGEQRVVDMAIGCGVGLLVSVIFWPRGASSQLRDALVESVAADGRWFVAEIDRLLRAGTGAGAGHHDGDGDPPPTVDPAIIAAAQAARWRADQALVVYVTERGAHRLPVARAQALVNGGDFLELAASATAARHQIDAMVEGACPAAVDELATRASSTVAALAAATGGDPLPPLEPPSSDALERCVAALDAASSDTADAVIALVFAAEWIDRVGVVARRLGEGATSSPRRPNPAGRR